MATRVVVAEQRMMPVDMGASQELAKPGQRMNGKNDVFLLRSFHSFMHSSSWKEINMKQWEPQLTKQLLDGEDVRMGGLMSVRSLSWSNGLCLLHLAGPRQWSHNKCCVSRVGLDA